MKKIKIQKGNKFKITNLLAMTCFVLVCAIVYITISSASTGATLSKLEKEEASLVQQNNEISESLVNKNSLSKLYEESSDLGFFKPTDILYINVPESVAQLP